MGPHYLEHLFAPQAIAVFGASDKPDAVGARVYQNLLHGGFTGSIYPVNPKYKKLGKAKCYADIGAIKAPVSYAHLTLPTKRIV